MKTTASRLNRAMPYATARLAACAGALAALLAAASLKAPPAVETLSGGPSFGYVDGDTRQDALFRTPIGMALDTSGSVLYVADRDNNAIRKLDLALNLTITFLPNEVVPASLIAKPVGVAVDADGNLYVLNQGNGNNGTVLKFDRFGNPVQNAVGTNAMAVGLTNANGLALDSLANIYVTVQGNKVNRIAAGTTNMTTVATITNAGTLLRGIAVTSGGLLAVCDFGRHGILLIHPSTGSVSNLTGFNGVGDRFGTKAFAKFNQPYGIAAAGGNMLVVTDYGNHRVKVADAAGTVTNLYGVCSNNWVVAPGDPSVFPGWHDGNGCPSQITCQICDNYAEARLPAGVVFASNGDVYTTEVHYHLIRKVTSTGLPLPPPPPPPVPNPQIGWVDFTVPPATIVSVLRPGPSFVFNNDVTIAIAGTAGTETHYTFGPTPLGVDTIPDPSPTVGSTPPPYRDGLFPDQVPPSIVLPQPDVTIKAIGFQAGRPSSAVVSSRFQFKTASPVITGNNAASFTVSCLTIGAQMWYTTDGTDPTTNPPSVGPISSPANLSLNLSSNFTFKIRAFRDNYQPSEIVAQNFSPTNFNANKITFGFASGEASSEFVASAGQNFYAPVTLSVLPATRMYSLQFNVTVTNVPPATNVAPGGVGFISTLVKPDPQNPGIFVPIPPAMFLTHAVNPPTNPPPTNTVFPYNNGWFQDLRFVNSSNNLIGVGWLERKWPFGTNLYDTTMQDLIKYSLPHDTLFDEDNGKVVLGGYFFRVPPTATPDQQYQIQIGRPSATSDGVGAPGSDVFIDAPTNGPLTAGAINSIKVVTVGQRKYVVGDAAPFRWFNAGDFGNGSLLNDDVMQVFQSAIYGLNSPLPGSDFEDAMNSCCGLYTNRGNGYLELDTTIPNDASRNPLFDGDDTLIDRIAFGDTDSFGDAVLDVTDVYVTFRRSLDPSRQWFQRFWTNGVRAAEFGTNRFRGSPSASPPPPPPPPPPSGPESEPPAVAFIAGDALAAAGQTLQIPVTARIRGSYPLRLLMLSLRVQPLDGSPALTQPVQFSPVPALGTPTMASTKPNSYSAAWLNSAIAGISGTNLVGTLRVTIPGSATPSAAYAVYFEHASGSPNGIAPFPKRAQTGLITLSDRSGSSLNDGIPDSWRLRYFGSVYNLLSGANADADGDGLPNWAEHQAGTDPNDSRSVLRLLSSRMTSAGGQPQAFVIRWPTAPDKRYVIERSATLFNGSWVPVSTNIGTGWEMEFSDPNVTATPRFYRVRVTE